MHCQNRFATLEIWTINCDLTIKAAWAQQRWI
jgi:hypothetical protein